MFGGLINHIVKLWTFSHHGEGLKTTMQFTYFIACLYLFFRFVSMIMWNDTPNLIVSMLIVGLVNFLIFNFAKTRLSIEALNAIILIAVGSAFLSICLGSLDIMGYLLIYEILAMVVIYKRLSDLGLNKP